MASVLAVIFAFVPDAARAAEGGAPRSVSRELETAAGALAGNRIDDAERGFSHIATALTNTPFVRGLARLGLAQTALEGKDTNSAIQTWEQLMGDNTMPTWQRDFARRRCAETKRILKGLPGRNPNDYRVELPSLPEPSVAFHVSTNGDDTHNGSEAHPFASVARARDAIREYKKSHGGSLPKGGAKVWIGDGHYQLKESIKLASEDSGTADAPIVYTSRVKGGAVFGGGLPVRGWRPLSSSVTRAKIDPAVRGKVLEADLKANGIVDWGDATGLKKRPELFVNGVPQTLARWPNEGFVKTGEILGTNTFKVWNSIPGCKDGKFQFVEERPARWLDEPDVRLYGYWFWDWYEEYQQVASIDADQKSFTLTTPYSNYGYRKGQRYFAVNVFRELDQPGEWYLDRRSGRLFWLPPDGLNISKAQIMLSIFAEPFITLENVQHVILLGLDFQEGRGDGIHITGGSDCIVAGCSLRRLGGDAITVEGGLHHGIFGCVMSTLGCGAMRVNGGDRKALTPGNHFVENCLVSDIARIKRTYAPAVHLDGCGNRIAHNLFERIPSSAMRIEGNDHLVQLNLVRKVVQESDDQGGIDMFGNPLYRGVVIRWNRWSDIIGGTECGAAGIRLDDMISGTVIQGNLFERCGAVQFGAVQVHGGKENVIDGNVFVDCHAAVSFSRWDGPRWLEGVEPFLAQAGSTPYATRYPDLARLKSEPNINFISRNLLYGCRGVFLRDGGVEKSALIMVSADSTPAGLLSEGTLPAPAQRGTLLERIPVAEMGPYDHPWRAAAPAGR
jgi:hypothetical protein